MPFSGLGFIPIPMGEAEQVSSASWHREWHKPDYRKIAAAAAVALAASGVAYTPYVPSAEIVTVDKWYRPLSEPIRVKLGLPAAEQQALAFVKASPFPETVTEDRWHASWSEPVRVRPHLGTALQQFLALHPTPSPFVATGWFNWFSEPVRLPQRLSTGSQQTLAYGSISPVVPFEWSQWLTEPVRTRQLRTSAQQSLIWSFFTPAEIGIGWFNPLADPNSLQKQGLHPNRQQYLAYHPRILPTPSVTGTLSATEDPDTLLFGGVLYERPISAEVSIFELSRIRALAALAEQVQVNALKSVVETVTTPTAGPAVSNAVTAIVAITQTSP